MVEIKEDDFLIENQDLIGAISSALARGEELRDAMLSLYNAGYDKTKIEEAVRAYIELSKNQDKNKYSKSQISTTPMKEDNSKDKEKPKKGNILDEALAAKAIQPTANMGSSINSTTQHVSRYDFKEKNQTKAHRNSNIVTFLLIAILVFLLLVLGAVFLFKEELVNFFNRLFA